MVITVEQQATGINEIIKGSFDIFIEPLWSTEVNLSFDYPVLLEVLILIFSLKNH